MRTPHLRLKVTVLALFALATAVVFLALYTLAGGRVRLGDGPYTAKVLIPDAQQLVEQGDVRLGGVKVGRVTEIGNRGRAAIVTFELDDDHAPLYRDGRVLLRTKTLVGESYLAIDPGSPRAGELPEGGMLPLEQADESVRLDQILSALDPVTRRRLQRNLRTFGAAVDGRGPDIGRIFGAARPTVADGGRVMQTLRGQREQLAALVADTGAVMQAFGDRSEQVRTLVRQANQTAGAVAERDEALGQFVEELPATLDQARTSVTNLGGFASRATPVARELRLAATDLTPVIRDLRPTARDARRLVLELPPLLRVTDPLLRRLRSFSERLPAMTDSLAALLRQTNPILTYASPYAREAASFFANVGSAAATRDAAGNVVRIQLVVSEDSYAGFTPEMRTALEALIRAGAVDTVHKLETNPYPKPGTLEDPQAFSGEFPRLEPESGR